MTRAVSVMGCTRSPIRALTDCMDAAHEPPTPTSEARSVSRPCFPTASESRSSSRLIAWWSSTTSLNVSAISPSSPTWSSGQAGRRSSPSSAGSGPRGACACRAPRIRSPRDAWPSRHSCGSRRCARQVRGGRSQVSSTVPFKIGLRPPRTNRSRAEGAEPGGILSGGERIESTTGRWLQRLRERASLRVLCIPVDRAAYFLAILGPDTRVHWRRQVGSSVCHGSCGRSVRGHRSLTRDQGRLGPTRHQGRLSVALLSRRYGAGGIDRLVFGNSPEDLVHRDLRGQPLQGELPHLGHGEAVLDRFEGSRARSRCPRRRRRTPPCGPRRSRRCRAPCSPRAVPSRFPRRWPPRCSARCAPRSRTPRG